MSWYVDDLCILVRGENALDVLRTIGQAADWLEEQVRTFQLELNHGVKKTEAIVRLQGSGLKQAKQKICKSFGRDAHFVAASGREIRLVGCYKYLGARVTVQSSQRAEVVHRCGRATQAWIQLLKAGKDWP